MQRAWPVAINAIGSASTATVAWRQGPHCFVTAVVKGTFAFVPNGPMATLAPEPIFAQEQEGAPGLGLGAADDLAPYLGQTDVALTGHAPAPRSPAMRSVRVRLSIYREGAALLDKTLDLKAPLGGAPRPIPIVGMGPISKRWPIRRHLLGAVDPRCVEGPILEIPAAFDWRYFQASSSDLRVSPLRGDEWLVLEGVLPTHERLVTQLPGARAVARLYRQTHESPSPLALALDTLRIDVDRRCCSIIWRGRFPVSGELSSSHILAGVELPGRPLPWPDFPQFAAPSLRPAIAAPPEEDPLEGTVMMMDVAFARAGSARNDDSLEGTVGLGESAAAELAARPATPFRSDISSPLPVAVTPAREPPIVSEDDDPLRGTVGLDAEMGAKLAARPATPFEQHEMLSTSVEGMTEATPAEDPHAATLGLGEDTAVELAGRPAMPFRTDGSSPLAAPSAPFRAPPAASHDDPLGATRGLDPLTVAALSVQPAMPFREAPRTPTAAAATPLSAADDDPLGCTAGLDEHATAMVAARAAMPFRSDLSSPLAVASNPVRAVSVAEAEDDPLRGTLWLDERKGAELAARGVVPFQQAVAQAPVPLFALHADDDAGMPRGLGAQFLAAMAAIEAAQRAPSC